MKKIDLKCPSCGANMHLSEDKMEAVCPYCSYTFLLEKEVSIEELSQNEEKLSYARKVGEQKAIEDTIRRKKKHKILSIIICISILLTICTVTFLINYFSLEYMQNPFECINVEFTGVDGDGNIKITDTNKCENYTDIQYNSSKQDKLNEGDKIIVRATSSRYRFGTSSKEYTVSGLSKFIISLDELTDEMLNKLHGFSYAHLKDNLGITFQGEVVNLTPYKLFLYTNGQSKNILYDVYKISIKTASGNIYDKFVVAYYKDFVILNNSELFSYSKLYHCGNTILAGDLNEYNAMSKNYAGFITGFKSIDDFKIYINKDNDGSFTIKEK